MKKTLLLLGTILSLLPLNACNKNNKKTRITYGTYVGEELTDIKYDSLVKKMEGDEKGENFLLATYFPDSHCSCWSTFQKVLKNYKQQNHIEIYKISTGQFSDERKTYGITVMHEDTPTLVVVENGKVKKEYIYNSTDMFKQCDKLESELNKTIEKPNMYYVDLTHLDNAILTQGKTLIHYIWNFCPDCQYCAPHVLYPYSDSHQFTNKLYIVDIGPLTMPDGTFESFDKSNPEYIKFLTDHNLNENGNATFGYGNGFVPTTQYYENGVLKDMSVYFNDKLEKVNDNEYKVASTYYTEERASSLKYLDNVKTKVLKDLIVPKCDVDDSGSWLPSKASVYHNPLLISFLDTYAI